MGGAHAGISAASIKNRQALVSFGWNSPPSPPPRPRLGWTPISPPSPSAPESLSPRSTPTSAASRRADFRCGFLPNDFQGENRRCYPNRGALTGRHHFTRRRNNAEAKRVARDEFRASTALPPHRGGGKLDELVEKPLEHFLAAARNGRFAVGQRVFFE